MTISEKILAKSSGKNSVVPGETIQVKADKITLIDATFAPHQTSVLDQLEEIGGNNIVEPERIIIYFDHFLHRLDDPDEEVPAHNEIKTFSKKFSIPKTNLILPDQYAISHVGAVHEAMISPGDLVIGQDSHAPTMGGVGCFAVATGFSLISDLVTGRDRLEVPETLKFQISGEFSPGVTERDLIQVINRDLALSDFAYSVLEFSGEKIQEMNIDQRMALCNRATGVGATTGIINPDDVTKEFFAKQGNLNYQPLVSDDDANYKETYQYDVSQVEPMVAKPGSPKNTSTMSDIKGTQIDQAFIGSCAGGYYKDLRQVNEILQTHDIHENVDLIISPASKSIYQHAAKEGIIDTLRTAGATITDSACAPCYGAEFALDKGEVCIANSTINTPGRMGSSDADVYLASTSTVTASAVTGFLTSSREISTKGD